MGHPPKPEDIENLAGLGTDVAEKITHAAANANESAAEAIRLAYVRGAGKGKMQRAAAKATQNAKNFERASKLFNGFVYALAADDAYENLQGCMAHP